MQCGAYTITWCKTTIQISVRNLYCAFSWACSFLTSNKYNDANIVLVVHSLTSPRAWRLYPQAFAIDWDGNCADSVILFWQRISTQPWPDQMDCVHGSNPPRLRDLTLSPPWAGHAWTASASESCIRKLHQYSALCDLSVISTCAAASAAGQRSEHIRVIPTSSHALWRVAPTQLKGWCQQEELGWVETFLMCIPGPSNMGRSQN